MTTQTQNSKLVNILDSGSARVFNCLKITRQIENAAESADTWRPLFRVPALNKMILMKEATRESEDNGYLARSAVRTKIYFPYDSDSIYEGGQSAYADDRKLLQILQHFGGSSDRATEEGYEHDHDLIKTFDELPSLDPFLLKDKLAQRVIEADDRYFQISEAEWRRIREQIRGKMRPMVEFAFAADGGDISGKTNHFIDVIWRSSDLDAMRPLIDAFRIDREAAPEVFYAWKGVAFYEYEYARLKPEIVEFADWLKTRSSPRENLRPYQKDAIQRLQKRVRQKLKVALVEIGTIFEKYNTSYDNLFKKRDNAVDFISFLNQADVYFWSLGGNLNKVAHAIDVWRSLIERYPDGRLSYEASIELFQTLDSLL